MGSDSCNPRLASHEPSNAAETHSSSRASHDTAISIRNLSKKYKLYDTPQHRLKEALNLFGKRYHRDFWALRDLSFDVRKGETVGIIGRNGSGKSTLLQIICGIIQPSAGEIVTNGRVSALLELGAGFNPEFTGRSNVYMNGALMGFSAKEINSKISAIEEFAEIGQFIDQPMKTYSSGMYVRLAFACALNVKPDIFVIDEALSVGDVFFQQKCFKTIRKIISEGTTCLFVSHDTTAIMNLCSRALLLDKGEVDFLGAAEEAVGRYYSKIGTRESLLESSISKVDFLDTESQISNKNASSDLLSKIWEHNIIGKDTKHFGSEGLKLRAAYVGNPEGEPTLRVEMMRTLRFSLLIRANEEIPYPTVAVQLYDRLGNLVFAAGTQQLRYQLPPLLLGEELVVQLDLTFTVQPGEYTFELILGEPSPDGPNVGFVHDRYSMLGPISVQYDMSQTLPFYGIAQLPMKVNVHRIPG